MKYPEVTENHRKWVKPKTYKAKYYEVGNVVIANSIAYSCQEIDGVKMWIEVSELKKGE